MSREPKVDRVKFQEDLGRYFRDIPTSEFVVFDNGTLCLEPPENYKLYTDVSGIDTLLVKLGTSIITHDDYKRTIYNMNCASEDITRIKEEKKLNLLVVSSGAIALGRKARLSRGERIPEREKNTPKQKQLDAKEGQYTLFQLWRHHFYPQLVEESLVTHDMIRDPQQKAKLLRRYQTMFSEGKIPVINEYDAKSIEEIDIMLKGVRMFRDNDGLSSLHVRFLKEAGYNPLFVILSNTNGIYTAESFRNGTYIPISVVKKSTGLKGQALPIGSKGGTGRMISKIEAVRDATLDDIYTTIACGQFCNHDAPYQERIKGSQRRYDVLFAILDGKFVGTRFLPYNYSS